ncbi:phosphoglycolate phosphatase [mine drainage metagenome]|uniref:Phosphoglycolate phosphatase n=1 Tax=mine drainage metagenome TaxID=410659 RepID=A0A1J5SCS8_9ZZZZ
MSVPVFEGLRQAADRYDAFILDLWGVIHDGTAPYDGVADTLAHLKAAGKKTVMLSNAPRRASALVTLMDGMGIARDLYGEVMSSGEAVHLEMQRRADPWFAALGRRCLHVGPERDRNIFEGLDLDLVTEVAEADFLMNTGPDKFEETVADYAPLLDQALARRLPMVCANPDLIVIRKGQEIICAGMLARYYAERGGDVRYRGKPDPAIYGTCLEILGLSDRARVMAVGDSFHTDIAGARAAGIDVLFCTGGIHAAEIGTRYGERPDPARIETVIAAHDGLRPSAAIGGFLW